MAEPMPEYPRHWEADVVLRDGGTAHLRPIMPADADALMRFHNAQSAESIYLRFFAPMPRLSDRDLERFTHVDFTDRVALIATVGGEILGVGRYDRSAPGQAEVAFNIADAHQGRGLGSVLLEHLVFAARENGIHRFVAEVLPHNRKMVKVFQDAGFEVKHHYEDGVVSLDFDIDPTDQSIAVMAAREHRAEASSLQALLHPRSVVVVGASRRQASVGTLALRNLLAAGFAGTVSAVHHYAADMPGGQLHGVDCYARVSDVPGQVDLAVVAVPASAVPDVVLDCARVGVRGVVLLSGGFAETGPDGVASQRELVLLAREHGMRVVGPNSFGMLNTDPTLRLNATLAPHLPPAGGLGLFSQSGALGVAVLSSASRRGLGVSSFVSAGNRSDVSGNDLMQFWEEDPTTTTVGLYLESVGNPRKFSRVARRLARVKPVVVVKSGISGYGVPPGHAVRLTRAPRESFDAMLRQAGVIRVENIHQLFDVAQVLQTQPLPGGQRVGIVGNSSALASLAADACVSWGLTLGTPPVSLHPMAEVQEFRTALADMFAREEVDAVVACFIPPLFTDDAAVATALAQVAAPTGKTTLACFMGTLAVSQQLSVAGDAGAPDTVVPGYPSPEDAVRALAAVTRYAQWRRRDPGVRPHLDGCDVGGARALVEAALLAAPADASPTGWAPADGASGVRLAPERVAEVLGCYGVSVWPSRLVASADEAVGVAETLGWPVAVQFAEPELRERRDLGGVRLNVDGPGELRTGMASMQAQLVQAGETGVAAHLFVVQKMAPSGVQITLKTMEDPLFGPLVSFGMAGDASDLLGDIAYRIPPLTDVDVADLIRSVKASPRLFGYRGTPPLDVTSLEDLVVRVSQLADELPEVAELALTPVIVAQRGITVLDAEMRVAHPTGRTDASGRRSLG